MMFRKPRTLPTLAACFVAFAGAANSAERFTIPLDGDTSVVSTDKRIVAHAGEDATFIPSSNRQALLPAAGHSSLVIETPAEIWQSSGTLGFNFKPDRRLSSGPTADKSNFKTRLIDCPLFTIDLRERSSQLTLYIALAGAGGQPLKARLNWSRLSAEQWYHLAFAWDANKTAFECFLNGSLQEKLRFSPSLKGWRPPAPPEGALTIGGTGGSGTHSAALAIDHIQMFDNALDEAALRKALRGRARIGLAGEGRTEYFGKLSFHTYDLELFYTADFSQPLNVVAENDLFRGDKRARKPDKAEWVLEGPGRARTVDGKLQLESLKPDQGGHVVLWNTREFPENCLIEFDMSPANSTNGLNILFFAARSRDERDIFDLSLPKRDGVFKNYHSGAIDAYHASYWACGPDDGGTPRRTANLRKNRGFQLVNVGADNIAGKGSGPHVVRLLKYEGRILLETAGQLSAVWYDDGKSHGPALMGGRIGLRQMAHTGRATYGSFTVYKISKKKPQSINLPQSAPKKK